MLDQGIIVATTRPRSPDAPRIRTSCRRWIRTATRWPASGCRRSRRPIATTTGWALRRDGFGENDGCEASGQHVPFKTTKAERLAAGDPRLSLEERYKTHDGYVAAVTKAAEKLEKQRFLLPADVQEYIKQAQASPVLRQE